MSTTHDSRYKRLFSNPEMVKELIESFVNLSFVKDLDFTTLENTKKSFVTKTYKERESDIIYKIKYKGEDAYIYLLLEFQSTVDYYMAVRMLRYIMEFYDDLTDNFKKRFKKLPPVFPIMLYNGEAKWNAPESITEVIDTSLIDGQEFIPSFRYFKIAENEFNEDALMKINNAVAAVFYAENTDFVEIGNKFDRIKTLLSTEKPEIVNVFKSWLNNLFADREDSDILLGVVDTLWKEEKPMLLASLERFQKKAIEDGKIEGKIETARNLKAMGLDVNLIAQGVGLPVEEVENL